MSGTGEKADDTSNLNEFVSRSELLVFLEQARKTPIELLPHKSLLLLLISTSLTCSRAWIEEFLHWMIGYMHWRLGHHPSRNHPTKMMIYVDALTITIMVWEVIIMLVMILLVR